MSQFLIPNVFTCTICDRLLVDPVRFSCCGFLACSLCAEDKVCVSVSCEDAPDREKTRKCSSPALSLHVYFEKLLPETAMHAPYGVWIQLHKRSCPHCAITCELCPAKLEAKLFAGHVCAGELVSRHLCSDQIPRALHQAHVLTLCPQRTSECGESKGFFPVVDFQAHQDVCPMHKCSDKDYTDCPFKGTKAQVTAHLLSSDHKVMAWHRCENLKANLLLAESGREDKYKNEIKELRDQLERVTNAHLALLLAQEGKVK